MKPLALLLLVACASAVDSWDLDPALGRSDRQQHAIGGALIGAGVAAIAPKDWQPWQRIAAGVAASLVVGLAKEAIDANDSDRNSIAEAGDATATAVGGAVGAICITAIWRF